MLKEYQNRVVEEKADLDVKIIKLKGFLDSEATRNLAFEDTALLTLQLCHMEKYSTTLGNRIKRF